MNESGHSGIPESPGDQAFDPGGLLASLRTKAADRLDPVRFHYIEALARRVPEHRGEVRRILEGKLEEALTAYRKRFEQTQVDAGARLGRLAEQHPDAADENR